MKPRVELITRTQVKECDGRFICETAGICYNREDKSDKIDNQILEQLKGFWLKKHYSVFEFLDFDFKIQLSIVALKQITRHWNSSMMVKSGRYCKEDKMDFYLPECIFEEDVRPFVEEAVNLYKQLIESGIKTEDARYFLPQGLMTQMRFKFNLRDFLCSIYPQRHSKKAQKEIRDIVDNIMDEVINNSSNIIKEFLIWYKNEGIKSVER